MPCKANDYPALFRRPSSLPRLLIPTTRKFSSTITSHRHRSSIAFPFPRRTILVPTRFTSPRRRNAAPRYVSPRRFSLALHHPRASRSPTLVSRLASTANCLILSSMSSPTTSTVHPILRRITPTTITHRNRTSRHRRQSNSPAAFK